MIVVYSIQACGGAAAKVVLGLMGLVGILTQVALPLSASALTPLSLETPL